MIFHTKRRVPKPSPVFDTYWRFAKLRQDIFFDKIQAENQVVFQDEILQKHKFTNAYRASDRVSQYLIRNVIYSGDQTFREVFFRTILFKLFNKISTWELLEADIGELSTENFNIRQYANTLAEAVSSKETIYSGAYIMASGKSTFGYDRKYENHLQLVRLMLDEHLPERIQEALEMGDVFTLLKSYPTIGSFLAFQFTIDLNYSASLPFNESDFVVPGPGAKDGIRKCFIDYGDYSEADIIKYVTDRQELEFNRLNLNFKSLWGRSLQLIDCQNLFCEVDKYARVHHPEVTGLSDRKRIKQLYKPNHEPIQYWYPPKWGINEKITQ